MNQLKITLDRIEDTLKQTLTTVKFDAIEQRADETLVVDFHAYDGDTFVLGYLTAMIDPFQNGGDHISLLTGQTLPSEPVYRYHLTLSNLNATHAFVALDADNLTNLSDQLNARSTDLRLAN